MFEVFDERGIRKVETKGYTRFCLDSEDSVSQEQERVTSYNRNTGGSGINFKKINKRNPT